MQKKAARSPVPARRTKSDSQSKNADDNYVDIARSLVLKSWPQIVRGLISKSRKGGYQHTKLLMDLCGMLKTPSQAGVTKDQQQLCDVLLKSLQVYVKCDADGNQNERVESTINQQGSQDGYEKHTGK